MDIKEIALRVAEEMPSGFLWYEGCGYEAGILPEEAVEFAEALIESYKAELLNEVGEPVLYAEFAEDGGWLGDASEYVDHLEEPHALFTSDQVAAAILKATKLVEEEVKAANSECELFRKNGRISDANEIAELRDQLAKAEQLVADACANYVNRFINGDGILNEVWISDIESALRNGEWRKHMKGD